MKQTNPKFRPGDAGYYAASFTTEEVAQPDPAAEEIDRLERAAGHAIPISGGDNIDVSPEAGRRILDKAVKEFSRLVDGEEDVASLEPRYDHKGWHTIFDEYPDIADEVRRLRAKRKKDPA